MTDHRQSRNVRHAGLRRRLCAALLGLPLLAGAAAATAQSKSYPSRPVHLIVPVPPGGPSDLAARALADGMGKALGQPLVLENRPGASGMLGTSQALRAAPDGYTLFLSLPSGQITSPLLMESPPFDGVRDFTPIGQFVRFTSVLLVHESVPVLDFGQLVQYVRQHPGALNYGSTGVGSNPHLTTELVKLQTGMDIMHVPYKGGAAMVQALVANEIQVLFGEVNTALPWIQSGQVRPLAVLSEARSPLLPDVPSLVEARVLDAAADFWMGLAGPPGLPQEIVARLHEAMTQAVQGPEMQRFFAATGSEAALGTPEALAALWAAEHDRASEVIRTKQIKAE
ncbi:MAG: tripartite tricarboxylate transporter substrate binding protein [Pigmentiphaga sp.]|nr:tripartite tricarboxylate transporter substrate binding protein [Pigmentiphaga sp.]